MSLAAILANLFEIFFALKPCCLQFLFSNQSFQWIFDFRVKYDVTVTERSGFVLVSYQLPLPFTKVTVYHRDSLPTLPFTTVGQSLIRTVDGQWWTTTLMDDGRSRSLWWAMDVQGHGDGRSLIRTVDLSFRIYSYISFLHFHTYKIIIHANFDEWIIINFFSNHL